MSQRITKISSKDNDTRKIFLAQHDARHISSQHQETLHLSSNKFLSYHIQIYILHTLHQTRFWSITCKNQSRVQTRQLTLSQLHFWYIARAFILWLLFICELHTKIFFADIFELGMYLFNFLYFIGNIYLLLCPVIVNKINRGKVRFCGGGSGFHHAGCVFDFSDLRCA